MRDEWRQSDDPDDGRRGATGLGLSLVDRPNGKTCLVFDDLERISETPSFQWSTRSFFTRVEVDLADVLDASLDDDLLARIGLAVVARLAAHRKHDGKARA